MNKYKRGIRHLLGLAGLVALAAGATGARAQGTLVMYCGVDEPWCRAVATTYQRTTGVQVDMTRMSAGEVYARVRAEKDNPHGDIWFGGTGDPHLQAADEGLTEPYQSSMLPKLREWAQRQA
ncbi:MAG TPA: iron ABC transporter substrate-binding protein, partial [Acetobacteraceae bacterium]|nr:iron ABC transporter substrate-binding protein [Acetobacteraceae bacterium]